MSIDKKKILIVDDVDINRILLEEVFKEEYDVLEACDGEKAVKLIDENPDIAAVLLDLLMPKMGGLDVLKSMNKTGAINKIPVFIVTGAEENSLVSEAYNLGAIDVVRKPFFSLFLKKRVRNVIELYRHKNELEVIVAEQVEKLGLINRSMVETLATIVEFRSCETGEHVRNICGYTEKLMTAVSNMFPEYRMPKEEIDKIVTAATLHDVGKIAIPDSILNKPGRLTKEEFEIMKSHTTSGCEMLKKMADVIDEELYGYSYDICRHHHERWDGRGYPDGLKGDEITIWAQVVSVADVYDALTSERVYKKAFSHEKAVEMIYNGECGIFNPKVLNAFKAALE